MPSRRRSRSKSKTRRRVSRSSSEEIFLCKCSVCCAECPSGCDVGTSATYYAHQREEKLRKSLALDGIDELAKSTKSRALGTGTAPQKPTTPLPLPTTLKPYPSSSSSKKPAVQSDDPELDKRYDDASRHLKHVRDQYTQRSLSFSLHGTLSFVNNPSKSGTYQHQSAASGINSGLHALTLKHPSNRAFLEQEGTLFSLLQQLDSIASYGNEDIQKHRRTLNDKITFEINRLDRFKYQEWERQRLDGRREVDPRSTHVVNTAPYFSHPHHTWNPVVLACYLLVIIMNLTFRLPRRGCEVLLAGLRCIVGLATAVERKRRGEYLEKEIPKTLSTVLNAFDIEPRIESYICCPECFALYPDEKPYPSNCTNRYANDSLPCDAKLLRKRKIGDRHYFYPVKKHLHQGMKEWMGRFLSRSGIEDLMEDTISSANSPGPQHDPFIRDILGALGMRNFRGPDGKPFLVSPPGESRYVFSFAADSFNPFGNKEAKQKVSSTGIYLVCLNLPADIRHKPENMYLVDVIAGKPSLTEINHVLKLVIKDLNEFWNPGVSFSRTAKSLQGRLVRAALVPVVCDALGARQILGVGGVTSTFFCTYCYISLSEIENLDRSTWPQRDPIAHRQIAQEWLAGDAKTKEKIFKETGIRWTEFLNLPYWNPVTNLVVDSMHNLYLGLLQRHCREIWGMNIKYDDSNEGLPGAIPPVPPEDRMEQGHKALREGSLAALNRCTRPVLWYLCEERNVRRAGTIKQLADSLMEWLTKVALPGGLEIAITPPPPPPPPPPLPLDQQKSAEIISTAERQLSNNCGLATMLGHRQDTLQVLCRTRNLPDTGTRREMITKLFQWRTKIDPNIGSSADGGSGSSEAPKAKAPGRGVLGRTVLTAAHEDARNVELPSWVNPVPSGFGTTSHGKLSADQWRTLCSINLPTTLIRLWGESLPETQEYKMLHNFMDLVTAVEVGSMLVTSEELIQLYDKVLTRYLTTLKELYKEAKIVPNHHLALHITDFLRIFGPVHAWRAFALERYNYMLQQTNTNNRLGEVEMTFMKSACRAANLQPLLNNPATQSLVGELTDAFSKFVNEDQRGTRIHNAFTLEEREQEKGDPGVKKTEIALQPSVYDALLARLNLENQSGVTYVPRPHKTSGQRFLSNDAISCRRIQINGVRYQPEKSSSGNSNAMYRVPGYREPIAGRISDIFLHTRKLENGRNIEETFLVARPLVQLSTEDSKRDLYRQFPIVGGSLHYARYDQRIHVLRPADVVCHFAKTTMGNMGMAEATVHVLPLDRLWATLRYINTEEPSLTDTNTDGMDLD